MFYDVFELVGVLSLGQQFAILLGPILDHDVPRRLKLLFLSHNLIEYNASDLLHRYIFVEDALPSVLLHAFVLEGHLDVVKLFLVNFQDLASFLTFG